MRKFSVYLVIFILSQLFFLDNALAAEEMKFTITPPLIKNNMEKGETWASMIKVTNNTVEPIKIYTQVVDFKSRVDGAGPEFIQKGSDENSKYFASDWLDIQAGPLDIGAQKSINIPFVVKSPADATPGGHYAAVLIGTKPAENTQGTAIKISSQVASLVMLNIKGEVKEKGDIREFSTDKQFYSKPKVKLAVKFINEGNVHLQPKGEINIFNLLGKSVGKFTINQSGSDFGNVLPESTRQWLFDWSADGSVFSMGRYRADLVLNYGSTAKETQNSSLYFWVINWKVLGLIIGVILLLIVIVNILLKQYIKRAVREASGNSLAADEQPQANLKPAAPVNSKTVDLRNINNEKKK